MIRDPSDGSVRETPNSEAGIPVPKSAPDTGIRQPSRTDAQERLERSREWLKQYHATKETTHARGNSSEQELPPAGDSIKGQREAEPGAPDRDRTDHGAHREG
jgi:hypothetical protein